MEFAKSNINGHQNVIVMRHGDRMDRFEPLWASTAERPWDPPLIHDGKVRAFQTGHRISSQVAFPIHRVFVSPFLRCIQTAVEVVAALSAVPSTDNSKLKVAIEFGLCEILNSLAIKSNVAPKDGKFDFKISDLEAMFPEGTVDHNVDMVYKELPQWEESAEGFRERYVNVLKVLAQKYPSENLLLITHRGGVSTILYKYLKDATKRSVAYCGCVDLRRQDGFGESMDFEVVTSHGIHDPVTSQSPV
ncbi:Phosphoglycerate mutase family protein [Raphanus sativus]|nr:Phosphoglycerate mutase family protein [Raphanus sativus]